MPQKRFLGTINPGDRAAVIQDAMNYLLALVKMEVFPEGVWTISPFIFDKRTAQIMQFANDRRPAGMTYIQPDEIRATLIQRGYKPRTPPKADPRRAAPCDRTTPPVGKLDLSWTPLGQCSRQVLTLQ